MDYAHTQTFVSHETIELYVSCIFNKEGGTREGGKRRWKEILVLALTRYKLGFQINWGEINIII